MEMRRILLGKFISLSFYGQDMNKNRPFQMAGVIERLNQPIKAVTIDRSHILELEGFKHHAGRKESDKGILAFSSKIEDIFPDTREGFEKVLQILFQVHESFSGHLTADKGREGAHVGSNGHGIIVQDHDQILLRVSGLIQTLKGHPGRHGTIADNRYDFALFPFQPLCCGYAQAS